MFSYPSDAQNYGDLWALSAGNAARDITRVRISDLGI